MGSKIIECGACNKEVSKSAKVCPHCGEKNGIKGFRKWINIVFCAFVAIGLVNVFFGGALNEAGAIVTAGTPACDSKYSKSLLVETFNGAQFARSANLSAIDTTEIKESSVSENQHNRSCSATISLNNTESLDVTFDMNYRESDQMVFLELAVVE